MANDAMFPAQTAAANSIGWQNNYFVVKGKPTGRVTQIASR